MDVSAAVYISVALLWVIVILQSLVLLGVVRIVHQLSADGQPRNPSGESAPSFEALETGGRLFRSSDLSGRMHGLLFVSPDCRSCVVTLDEMRGLEIKTDGTLTVICRSDADRCRQMLADYGVEHPVVVDADGEIARLYKIDVTPTAVLVGADGRIQSYGAPLREDLQRLGSDESALEGA